LSKFTAGGVFNKGLPSSASLQSQALAHVFQVILSQGFVLENDFPKAEHQEALDECFKNGWLHTERFELGATEGVVFFCFAASSVVRAGTTGNGHHRRCHP